MTAPDAGDGPSIPVDQVERAETMRNQRNEIHAAYLATLDENASLRGALATLQREQARLADAVAAWEASASAWDAERTDLVKALDVAGIPLPSTVVDDRGSDVSG